MGDTVAKTKDDVERTIEYISLDDLLLDANNPRFGVVGDAKRSQSRILDTIVESFGVDDLLSSIATNGFFSAEPLVGVRDSIKNKVVVMEGNRRLAAALILAGDGRAKNHAKRTDQYRQMQEESGQFSFSNLPVICHEDSVALLPYLGVRHITALKTWDSYAKAAWIVRVVEQGSLTLGDVANMIGDQFRTVSRLAEGYYFVEQLISADKFLPETSTRQGRGSNTTYPFSWIYTILGFRSVRTELSLEIEPTRNPIPEDKLELASDLLSFMFGDTSKSISSALSDSRDLAKLARVFGSVECRYRLAKGDKVDTVLDTTRSPSQIVSDSLLDAKTSLTKANAPISEKRLDSKSVSEILPISESVAELSATIEKLLREQLN